MKKIYLFATIFALLTGFAVYRFATGMENKKAAEEKTSAVVTAAQDIPENTLITAEMLTMLPVPEGSGGKAARSIAEVAGKITRYPLSAGEFIISDKLEKQGEANTSLSYALEKGKRAVSLSVDSVSGVSGYLQKGDKVDVIASYLVNKEQTTVMLFEDVKVMELGTKVVKKDSTEYETVTLAVSPQQALKLSYALSYGKVTLALHPVLDNSTIGSTSFKP